MEEKSLLLCRSEELIHFSISLQSQTNPLDVCFVLLCKPRLGRVEWKHPYFQSLLNHRLSQDLLYMTFNN